MRFDKTQDGRGRDSYHHGNLREALIAAALLLIAERGPAGFAFAELARAAGVSPAAPYRHFRDRNAVLGEIARRGFERFTGDLERAWQGGRPDPLRALEACGRAYLDFARREPAMYAVMFESGLAMEDEPGLLLAFDTAFAVLRRASEAACGTMTANRPPALMVALHVWSLAHGIASLFVERGERARRKLPMSPEELLEAGLLIYFQSVGLHGRAA
jgi:AcrR family transcriptional regulator